jgi:shikimate dehydrogenase
MKFAGVLGHPISHSLSPRLHGYWLREYNIEGAYLPFDVGLDKLSTAIEGLKLLGFAGANVTVPHKEAVLLLVDELTETARRIRSVNTLVAQESGKLLGDSTDGLGFMAAIAQQAPHWDKQKPVVILGAGGAARAVIDALHQQGVPEIRVVNRTAERTQAIAADLGIRLIAQEWRQARESLQGASLVVNTTTLGMTGQPDLPITLENLPENAVVFDLIYKPAVTPLLKQAMARGLVALNGLEMLLHQAVPGFAAWFGVTPTVSPGLRAHIEEFLS